MEHQFHATTLYSQMAGVLKITGVILERHLRQLLVAQLLKEVKAVNYESLRH